MAFMMPVVKNNYEIYPGTMKQQQQKISRSRRTSSSCRSNNESRSGSRTVSESGKGNIDVILLASPSRSGRASITVDSAGSMNIYSTSAPSSSAFVRPASQRTVRFIRSLSQDSNCRRRSDSAAGAIGSSSSAASTTSSASNVDLAPANAELASSPKSQGGLSKFHTRLVNKLKRKLGIKDDEVCVSEDDATVVRSST